MNKRFECLEQHFFRVPDGTLVNPFLNPKDVMSGLPWDLLDGLGMAAGCIEPGVVSEIHVHPFISQVTVLISGSLDIHMKDPASTQPPYRVRLTRPTPSGNPGFTIAASVALPGTFLQLDNLRGSEPAHVLYLTSPSYIFEPGDTPNAPPVYDDAVPVGHDWDRLAEHQWNPPELAEPRRSHEARRQSAERLRTKMQWRS